MTRIRAAVCREFGQPLSIEELELAPPGAKQIQVAVKASAVCHSDIHFFEGAWGGKLPAVWGHEAAGIVEAVGDDIDDIEVGDTVVITLIRSCGECRNCQLGRSVACTNPPSHRSPLSDGGGNPVGHGLGIAAFADHAIVARSQAVVIDAEMDLVAASLLACGVITGVGAARNSATIEPGSTVVVIGTGGVGLNAIQGARLCDAATIIAADINDTKLDAARQFGATDLVNSGTHDLSAEVRRITDGAMADYVLVTVGAQQPIEQAPTLLASGGTAVIVGMPASGVTATIDPVTMAALNQSIIGSKMGTSTIATDIPELVARYHDGSLLLDPLVTRTCSLDEINDAIAEVKDGSAIRNVIVFDNQG